MPHQRCRKVAFRVFLWLGMGLVSFGAGCLGAASGERHASRLVGQQAPDFTLPDLSGTETSLSEYRGKVVLLAFWAYG